MPKIRIKLRGFDHKTLDASAQKIVEAARKEKEKEKENQAP